MSAFSGSSVNAQSCHGPQLGQTRHQQPFQASLALLAANYDVNDYKGNYQGLWATFAYRTDWYSAQVSLPAYRLDHAQGIDYGLGDVVVTAGGAFFRALQGDLSMGVELPVMVPTGDWKRDLGMGNVMLMPNLYLALKRRPLVVHAQLGYGYMFGDMHMPQEHVEHQRAGSKRIMSAPLVNPMNMSEIEHAVLVGVQLPHDVSVHARWWGAVPVHSAMGVLRQAVAAGVTAALSRFDVTLELQRTLAGHAFEWKPLLQMSVNF